MTAFPWLDQVVTDSNQALPEPATRYLQSRGVTEAEWVSHRVGWLPADYMVPTCTAAFATWQQWYLRERLIFPITATTGDVVGLQSRALTDKRYQIFYAGHREIYAPIYGLGMAADLMLAWRQVVVVEGIFDYFAVRAAGVPNVLALLTAHTNQTANRLLTRYVSRVVALLDMDEAGRHGITSLRRAGTFEVLAPVYMAHDPADLFQQPHGPALLGALLTPAARPYGMWL